MRLSSICFLSRYIFRFCQRSRPPAPPRLSSAARYGGFTIIEVVLVLAIAGLIFLMVFIALPALQRAQRDSQRRNDLGKVTEAITNFQTNNQGRLPSNSKVDVREGDTDGQVKIRDGEGPKCDVESATSGDACNLLLNYLNGHDVEVDEFTDPDGFGYGIEISGYDGKFAPGGTELQNFNHKVYIVKQARCSGEGVVESSNKRDYSVLYKLEGTGVYCQDNG